MSTGIYTTKWFLQCFIDRVRMLWGFFAALLFACMVNLPGVFCKYHTLKKVLIFYKMGYYAHSQKREKVNKGEAKNNCMSLMTSQFLLPHHKQLLGDGSASAV